MANGYVSRPGMGVSLYEIDEYTARCYQLSVDYGLLLPQVLQGGPADDAGMEEGDIIVAVDGQRVTTVQELRIISQTYEVGQRVEVTFYRDESEQMVTVTLAEVSWE
jgi:S1-C subfamily serine protease